MKTDCNVIIVGAGMVGLALAAVLGRADFNVRLIEAGILMQNPPIEPGLRVSAISSASAQLLSDVGAWSLIPAAQITAYHRMRVWDASVNAFGDRALLFDDHEAGRKNLGHIVSNAWITWALTQVINKLGNVEVFESSSVDDILFDASGVRVFSDDHQQHVASLIVGADGGRSKVRSLSDINTVHKSYEQRAVVCTVATEHAHNETAWQRFLPSGPLAFLPLSDGTSSIVWSTSVEEAEHLASLNDADFSARLSAASDHVLGQVTVLGERASFPLQLQYAQQYVRENLALIGDAAHVVHPLAGQGVNMGFADARKLAQVLETGRVRGDDCGDLYGLRKYERARKYENRKMLLALDGLQQLFAARQPWLVGVRTLGMGVLNSASRIKRALVLEALD